MMETRTLTMPVGEKPSAKPRRSAAERRPHYMRQWRQSHGLTLVEMVARIETLRGEKLATKAQLSRVETGGRQYTQDLLEAYAEILECTPQDLLSRIPRDPIEVLRTLVQTAEDILRISSGGGPKN
jgi:transcriptional regulator with XRE-family HTH domain